MGNSVEQKQFANGFRYLEVVNSCASARIALQGAHLFHYQRRAEPPLLWLSGASLFEKGRAIRGGVPICWPWFGKDLDHPERPQHGFARISSWTLLEVDEKDPQTTVVTLELQDSEETLELWPYKFLLRMRLSIGRTLELALTTVNRDSRSFVITSALHSYLAVSAVEQVEVLGLAGIQYFDALTGKYQQQDGAIRIGKEVDRVYQGVEGPLELVDRERTIRLQPRGSRSAVVWNPWKDKCARMADMKADSYRTMLCIETANALADGRSLAPGEEHTLGVKIGY